MNRLLLIFYDHGIDGDIIQLLDRLEVEGYTRLEDAHGKGRSGKRFNDPVFPGSVNLALVALSEAEIPALLEGLRELEALFTKSPPIRVIGLAAEQLY